MSIRVTHQVIGESVRVRWTWETAPDEGLAWVYGTGDKFRLTDLLWRLPPAPRPCWRGKRSRRSAP
jgi:hypothetical protein